MNKVLSFTVGLTTCYGDISILETIKSLRASSGVGRFPIILIADRVPLTKEIKKALREMHVTFIENKKEGSQMRKQKQMMKLVKTDLLILTQDDVLLDHDALRKVVNEFERNAKLTMISILNKPVEATTLFEEILSVGTSIANKYAKYWNNGDNYLSVIGRFMAFRTEAIKNKFRLPESVATSDTYYYLENKRTGGAYKYVFTVSVYFKNPQNMKEHLRKSSRFQFSKQEMSHFFQDVEKEYLVPKPVIFRSLLEQAVSHPLLMALYLAVFLYTRILKMNKAAVLNPIWEVDLSTKAVVKGA